MTCEPLPCGCPNALQTVRRAGPYVLRRGTYLPSCGLGAHAHVEDRVILTITGHLESTGGGGRFRLGPPQALYRPAGVEHHDRYPTEAVCLAILLPDHGSACQEPFVVFDDDFAAAAARLAWEIDATDRASDLVIEGISAQVVGTLHAGGGAGAHAPRWIFRVRDRLHDEYASPPSLAEIAAGVERDATYLATTFRRTFGRTVGEYARELRIWHARPLVEDPDVPLIEIAARAGFSDQSHFSRLFRRRFGMPPGEYRRRVCGSG